MASGGDLLGNAISGLLASQRALTTTSHNISNVNTPGYSRQRAELVTRPPSETGFGFIGNGVSIDTISRSYDKFIVENLRLNTSLNAQLSSFHDFSLLVDQLLADPSAGLSPSMQSFFDAVQGVADDPSSIPARQVMLTEAESFATRFHFMSNSLENMNNGVDTQLSNAVTSINGLAESIARLNQDIVNLAGSADGQQPNDLLDQRDELIRQLSEFVAVSTTPQGNGEVNVFIGNGIGLVVGNTSSKLTTVNDNFNTGNLEIAQVSTTGAPINITNSLNGGLIGGVLDFRNNVLEPAINEIGRMATVLSSTFNDQHQLGQDLNGQLGGLFFDDLTASTPLVNANNSNTGTAVVSAAVSDASALTADDYLLRFDGANYTLTNMTTNVVTNLPLFPAGTEVVDGVSLNITAGAMLAGDNFLIRPTFNSASAMGVAITGAEEIAAAAPVRSSVSLGNTGNGVISQPAVNSPPPTDVNLQETITITFNNPPTTFNVNGVGTGNPAGVAYVNGSSITFNGHTFEISGAPQAGDTFTIESNVGGVSDNRNALLLGSIQNLSVVEGVANLQGAYSQFVANIGTQTSQAGINRAAQGVLLNQSVAARESVSGVNLDEEAANLIKFQQMYQAAAQVISVADTVFQTLIGAVRR